MMESHVADPLSQDQLAKLAGLSARQLQRLFRENLGHSVMQEYRRIRLETGRELAANTWLSLTEIAQMTGFASPSHFSDAFRQQFGEAPSRLRRARTP